MGKIVTAHGPTVPALWYSPNLETVTGNIVNLNGEDCHGPRADCASVVVQSQSGNGNREDCHGPRADCASVVVQSQSENDEGVQPN